MEFEKLKKIIAEVLNVDPEEITPESTFMDDLGETPWMFTRLSWASKKSLTLKWLPKRQKRLPQWKKLLI